MGNLQVTSKEKKYSLGEEDCFVQDNIMFIAQSEIEKWFNLTLAIDTAQQFIDIQSPYPLPYIARYNRQNKTILSHKSYGPPKFARVQNHSKWLDINTTNIRLGARHRHHATRDA